MNQFIVLNLKDKQKMIVFTSEVIIITEFPTENRLTVLVNKNDPFLIEAQNTFEDIVNQLKGG